MTLVAEVQKQCSDVMRILGYTTVRSDAELRDISKSLVVEWETRSLTRIEHTYVNVHKRNASLENSLESSVKETLNVAIYKVLYNMRNFHSFRIIK